MRELGDRQRPDAGRARRQWRADEDDDASGGECGRGERDELPDDRSTRDDADESLHARVGGGSVRVAAPGGDPAAPGGGGAVLHGEMGIFAWPSDCVRAGAGSRPEGSSLGYRREWLESMGVVGSKGSLLG